MPDSLAPMHTKYPTAAEDVGLKWLANLNRVIMSVGLSDHSGLYTLAWGSFFRRNCRRNSHNCDRRMFGPDAPASLTIDEFSQLVEGIRFLEKAQEQALPNKKKLAATN